jgi:metal transporter CNNM
MGLDELHLRVLATSSDNPTERKNAQKREFRAELTINAFLREPFKTVLNLMQKRRHWVLVVCHLSILRKYDKI